MRFRNIQLAACFLSLLITQSTMAAEDNSAVLDQAHTAMMKHDVITANRLLMPLAEKGDATAQNLSGDLCVLCGDMTKAVSWYKKAAEQGNAKAQNNLGMAYIKGQGITQNDSDGVGWLRKAAEQGHMKAQNNLSVMYSSGRGVAKDEIESAKWCKKQRNRATLPLKITLGLNTRTGVGLIRTPRRR